MRPFRFLISLACAMNAVDRLIAVAVGFLVVLLAGVAGAISYSHMAELARAHGEVGWRAHAFPVSVDGIEIVASLVLLAHRRAGTRAGWLPWAALAAGTVASVAANVAVGASDPVGRVVAIKLLSGLLDGPGDRRGPGDGPRDRRGHRDGPGRFLSRSCAAVPTVPGVPGDGLIDAAQAVRARLLSAERRVNRRTLGEGLRAAGHGVRNDKLGALLRSLASDPSDDA